MQCCDPHGRLDHLHHQIHAVRAINETLRTYRELSAVYPVVAKELARAIPFDSLLIGIYEREHDVIRYEYGMDEGVIDELIYRRALKDAPLSQRILQQRQLLVIPDLVDDPIMQQLRTFGQTDRASRAWMGVPMISGDEVQGMMAVMSYTPDAFHQDHTDLLLLVASQIAIAVENAQLIAGLQQTIVTLSTPLIPVADGVLVLPIVGHVDAERVNRIVDQTLAAVAERGAREVVIDVTGMHSVDPHIIGQIMCVVRALALLGARGSLAGIRPDIAQRMIVLNSDLGKIPTYRDLQSALATVGTLHSKRMTPLK